MRWAGVFIAGVVVGVLIGIMLAPRRGEGPASVAGAPLAITNSPTKTAPAEKPASDETKILLGNITTVPFQELYGLLSTRSPEEMTKLVQQLLNLPQGRETNAKITAFFKAWAHFDAKSAVAAAGFFTTPDAKNTAMAAVIDGADATAAGSLAAWINDLRPESLSPEKKGNFLAKALSKWSEVDPVEAARFLDATLPTNKGLNGARYQVAQNWAISDPEAALAWAKDQHDAQNVKTAMSGVIAGWWQKDPRAAESYVASNIDTLPPETAILLSTRLLASDPEHAKDWVSQLTNVEARRSADSSIAMQMASNDPKSASEWAASLPDDVRETALRGALSLWARRDPQAAEQWLNGLNGKPRDEAIGVYSSTLAAKDPATALAWATSVSDGKIRRISMERIIDGWLRRNPTEASAWINNSDLPTTEKDQLLAKSPAK